nr:MAG: replication associated protein [Cressdnaviricota sp.]
MPRAVPVQSKSRGWCWTINNPTDFDVLQVDQLKEYAKYWCYGREYGDDRGTEHLQGFVYFTNACGLGRVKSLLGRAHLEPQRGTAHQAIEYCKKDGRFVEWGEKPDHGGGRTQREKWRTLVTLAESGELARIRDEYPGEYFRYHERIRSLRIRSSTPINGDLAHEWWYGNTGTGKSRKLWEMYPDHYAKELNKWWDGYADETVVAIEEWAPKNECTASFLKVWADRYPFPAQIKGGSLKKIRPTKVIVLSNYTIDQCFPNAEDREPMKRRFKVVHFPDMFAPQFCLRTEAEENLDIVDVLLNMSQS